MALLNPVRAAALALLMGGCDFTHPPTHVPGDPGQLLVHAILVADADSAAVYLTRMGDANNYVRVHGARVRLLGEGHQTVLPELPPSATPCGNFTPHPDYPAPPLTGCYAAPIPGGVRAGAEYRLEVDVSSGERVRGRTVVPPHPAVHSPVEGLRVRASADEWRRAADSMTVRWTARYPAGLSTRAGRVWVPGVEGVSCHANAQRPFVERAEMLMDSVRVRIWVGGCYAGPGQPELRPDSVEVLLDVTTYDSAYAAYVREAPDGIPLPHASSGLEGAYGVFGSAAVSRRRLIYVTR